MNKRAAVATQIDGVIIKPLNLLPDHRGRLMYLQRRDDAEFPGFGAAYVTQSFSGVIKAWYRHRVQIDQLAAITGLVKLVLYDDREDSPTRGMLNEIMMGELIPRLVQFPPGIWHGFKAVGETSAFVVHLNSEPYNLEAPDDERRDAHDSSIPYEW